MITAKKVYKNSNSKNEYEQLHGKYIYKNGYGKYTIVKTLNGKKVSFGTFDTFQDAMDRRDYLMAHDWVKPKEEPSEEDLIKEYFLHVHLNNKKYNVIGPGAKGKYLGYCDTVEEALFYRDLAESNDWIIGKPKEYDLITDNPYLKNGLDFPVPDRLIPKKSPETNYGKGHITKKGPQSFHVKYNRTYFCACRTYEQAYYVRQELQKCDFDKSQLNRILEEYPKWYTWLLGFYRYIIPNAEKDDGWLVVITPKNNPNGKLEHIRFNNIEDALWERDLYLKYDFDEEAIVYGADDRLNPYYDMELPHYPERKVRRNLVKRFDDELRQIRDCILDGCNTLEEVINVCGISNQVTVRNWLKKYNTTWPDFKELCLSGEDPLSVLEFQGHIFAPDLSVHYSKQNYVSHVKSRLNPFMIQRRGVYYGAYPTRRMANKVVSRLRRCGWDKSKLKEIQDNVGFESIIGSKRWVYPNKYKGRVVSWSVRKKDKSKKMHNFGIYKLKEKAEYVRDRLVEVDWCDDAYPDIRADADRLFPDNDNLGDKYIHCISGRFRVFKDDMVFGWFDDYVMARLFRDLMVDDGWCLDNRGSVFCRVLRVCGFCYVKSCLL